MSIILLMVFYKASYLNIHHSVFVSQKTCTKRKEWAVIKVFIGQRMEEMNYLDIRSKRKIIVRVWERHDRGEDKNDKVVNLYNYLRIFIGYRKPISGKVQEPPHRL